MKNKLLLLKLKQKYFWFLSKYLSSKGFGWWISDLKRCVCIVCVCLMISLNGLIQYYSCCADVFIFIVDWDRQLLYWFSKRTHVLWKQRSAAGLTRRSQHTHTHTSPVDLQLVCLQSCWLSFEFLLFFLCHCWRYVSSLWVLRESSCESEESRCLCVSLDQSRCWRPERPWWWVTLALVCLCVMNQMWLAKPSGARTCLVLGGVVTIPTLQQSQWNFTLLGTKFSSTAESIWLFYVTIWKNKYEKK